MRSATLPTEPQTPQTETGCPHRFGVVRTCPECSSPRHLFTSDFVTDRFLSEVERGEREYPPRTEHCHECGDPVAVVWTAPDDLWAAVTGREDGGGIRCIPCFDEAAAAQGRFIRWVPQEEQPHADR